MRFNSWLKQVWKNQTNTSEQLIKDKPLWTENDRAPVNIEYKMHLNATELTSNQHLIDSVAKKIIRQDYSKRQYAGKKEKEIMQDKQRVYQYESYRTQHVHLVPNKANRLDVFVEKTYLGKLPQEYTSKTVEFLQSTVVMAFAYIKGGPYKYFDRETQSVKEGIEPFDLNIYIQFS